MKTKTLKKIIIVSWFGLLTIGLVHTVSNVVSSYTRPDKFTLEPGPGPCVTAGYFNSKKRETIYSFICQPMQGDTIAAAHNDFFTNCDKYGGIKRLDKHNHQKCYVSVNGINLIISGTKEVFK